MTGEDTGSHPQPKPELGSDPSGWTLSPSPLPQTVVGMVVLSSDKMLLENLVSGSTVQVCGLLGSGWGWPFPPHFAPGPGPCLVPGSGPGQLDALCSLPPLAPSLITQAARTLSSTVRKGGNATALRRPLARKRRLFTEHLRNLSLSSLSCALPPVSLRRAVAAGNTFQGIRFLCRDPDQKGCLKLPSPGHGNKPRWLVLSLAHLVKTRQAAATHGRVRQDLFLEDVPHG